MIVICREIILPSEECFYDFITGEFILNKAIEELNENCLVFVIGGSIFPFIPNAKYISTILNRISSYYTVRENLCLKIYPNKEMTAKGTIYIDDGETFAYERQQECLYLEMIFKDNRINLRHIHHNQKFEENFLKNRIIDQIDLYGINNIYHEGIKIKSENCDNHDYILKGNCLSIRGLKLKLSQEHSIIINYC